MNNSCNASTNIEPNVVIQGFRSNLDALDPLVELPPKDYVALRMVARDQAADAIAWAAASMKDRYDTKHRPVRFQAGQKVFLKLYKGYKIPGYVSCKLSPQRVGPFEIVRTVGRLACELKLPPTWRIHLVISVA